MLDWQDRALTVCAYHYALCLDEESFFAELERMELPRGRWPSFSKHAFANATTHFFENVGDNKVTAIVCLSPPPKDKTGVEIAALLCHEAVHLWQAHARHIGSFNDHGDEEEAYAIQAIAQNLMESYVQQRHR